MAENTPYNAYVFLDESGDTGRGEKSARGFIVAGIILRRTNGDLSLSPKQLSRQFRSARPELAQPTVKWRNLGKPSRLLVMAALARLFDANRQTITPIMMWLDKTCVSHDMHYRMARLWRQYLPVLLLEHLQDGDHIRIQPDRADVLTADNLLQLKESLERQAVMAGKAITAYIKPVTGDFEVGNQLADLIAGAANSYFLRGKEEGWSAISHLITPIRIHELLPPPASPITGKRHDNGASP